MIISPKIRISFVLIYILSYLFSCRFDDDAKYLPQTQVGYFTYKDSSQTTALKVLRVEGNYIEKNWQESWGISQTHLGGISAYENELWVSDVSTKEILQIDPASGLIHSKKKLENLTPNYICAGENYMLIADTLQNMLTFWNRNTDKLIRRKLSAMPTFSVYRSQKFFTVYDETQILIYQEQALVPIDSLDFGYKITDIQTNSGLYTIVFGQEGNQNFQGLIDYNTNTFEAPPSATSIIKARYSPYNRQVYGNEFLVDHILKPDRKISFVQSIQDFEVDFFEGNMYFIRNDSLSVFNHWTRETRNIIPFQYQLDFAFFYIN